MMDCESKKTTFEKTSVVTELSPMMQQIRIGIEKKDHLFKTSFCRYAVRACYACLFLSLGTTIAFSVAMKMESIVSNSGKFLYAFMFSWSLVMILFLNGELGTANMLYMTIAVHRKILSFKTAVTILFICIFFNLVGAIVCAYLLSYTGTFAQLASHNYFFDSVQAKLLKPSSQILVEGIFANIVVNIAVLMGLRIKEDTGKILVMIFIIYIFAFLGYEHVIANFPTFSLALFVSHGTLNDLVPSNILRNIFFALLGNYIGGGLIMGFGYSWLNSNTTQYLD